MDQQGVLERDDSDVAVSCRKCKVYRTSVVLLDVKVFPLHRITEQATNAFGACIPLLRRKFN